MRFSTIDKQKALRRDCIYNIENTDQEIGFQAFTYIYYNILTHFGIPADWSILRVTHHPYEIIKKNDPKAITQR